MITKKHVISCDGGIRPDGTFCAESLSDLSKSSLKGKAEGLGWTTIRKFLDFTTHICPACRRAAHRAGIDSTKPAR